MPQDKKQTVSFRKIRNKPAGGLLSMRWILPSFLMLGAVLLAAQQNSQNGQQSSNSQPQGQPSPDRAWTTAPPVAFSSQTDKQNFDGVNGERRKQIADDSAKLLKLATDLKTEVDKTNKDTLSLGVIRKADEIEKLAHSVKEKMKLAPGSN